MPKRKHEQLPIDPKLRTKAMEIIAAHQIRPTTLASDSLEDRLSALVPEAMKVLGDTIDAYDRGELSITTQKRLIATMKKIVREYGDFAT